MTKKQLRFILEDNEKKVNRSIINFRKSLSRIKKAQLEINRLIR